MRKKKHLWKKSDDKSDFFIFWLDLSYIFYIICELLKKNNKNLNSFIASSRKADYINYLDNFLKY